MKKTRTPLTSNEDAMIAKAAIASPINVRVSEMSMDINWKRRQLCRMVSSERKKAGASLMSLVTAMECNGIAVRIGEGSSAERQRSTLEVFVW